MTLNAAVKALVTSIGRGVRTVLGSGVINPDVTVRRPLLSEIDNKERGNAMSAEFCIYCGASKPIRPGEGTCNQCHPEFVFVGGENDGYRMRIPSDEIRDPVLLPIDPMIRTGFRHKGDPVHQKIENEVYRMEMIATGRHVYRFYRHEQLPLEKALYFLLRNYNPCSDSKDNRTAGRAR